MKKRFVLLGLAAVSMPVLLGLGCSTSNVHPPTFGDCLNPATCAQQAPTGVEAGAGGVDGGASSAIERTSVTNCKIIPNREVQGIAVDYGGNAWVEGTVTFRSFDEYGIDGGSRQIFITPVGVDGGQMITTTMNADNEPPRMPGIGYKLVYTYRFAGIAKGQYRVGADVSPGPVGRGYWTSTGSVKTAPEAELLEVKDDSECVKNVLVTAEKLGAGPTDGGADTGSRDAAGGG